MPFRGNAIYLSFSRVASKVGKLAGSWDYLCLWGKAGDKEYLAHKSLTKLQSVLFQRVSLLLVLSIHLFVFQQVF